MAPFPFSHWVLHDIGQLVTLAGPPKGRRRGDLNRVVPLERSYLEIRHGVIKAIGPNASAPTGLPRLDARGMTVLPGFIDPHTHLLFAGYRDDEFEERLAGTPYLEILDRGGGILNTVRATRTASPTDLKSLALGRIRRGQRHGTTTFEVKSGYGLSLQTELKSLSTIAALNQKPGIELIPTFLGAHTVPPEFAGRGGQYLEFLAEKVLPDIQRKNLARFCDIFCERGVFELADSERYLTRARDLGFGLRLHADEIHPLGGAELGARLGAASVDHLLAITPGGIEALGKSDCVATLLPGTAFMLRKGFAPARKLIDAGAIIGLATDCNPGTSYCENMQMILQIAVSGMGLTMAEALNAAIPNNAVSLGLHDRIGSLEVGKEADFTIFNIPNYRHLFYHYGINHAAAVFKRGRPLFPFKLKPHF